MMIAPELAQLRSVGGVPWGELPYHLGNTRLVVRRRLRTMNCVYAIAQSEETGGMD